jgi:chromosome segregation ATPase
VKKSNHGGKIDDDNDDDDDDGGDAVVTSRHKEKMMEQEEMIKTLRQKLELSVQEAEQARRTLQERDRDVTDLKARVVQIQKQHDDMKTERDKVRKERDDYWDQIDELQEVNQSLDDQCTFYVAKHNDAMNECHDLRRRLADANRQLATTHGISKCTEDTQNNDTTRRHSTRRHRHTRC